MISSSSHPSSSSLNSATGLTAEYRPPQKDYAAAYAALHEKYGSSAYGQAIPKLEEIGGHSKSATAPRSPQDLSSPPQPSENSASQATPSATKNRVQTAMRRLRAMLGSVFGFRSRGEIMSLQMFCDLTYVVGKSQE